MAQIPTVTGARQMGALLVMLVAVAGCGTTVDDSRTATPAPAVTTTKAPVVATEVPVTLVKPPGFDISVIEVFADYPRYLHHKRRLAVATTNVGDEMLHVSLIGLRTDHFEVLEPEVNQAAIHPGSRVDVQVDFGPVVDCEGNASAATVLIEVGTDSNPGPHRIELPLGLEPLNEIRDTECGRILVRNTVDIAFDDSPTREGDIIGTSLRFTRSDSDVPVTVTAARGTEIFAMFHLPRSGEGLPATLDPSEPELVVPIEFEVLRCDPHAVGQSTKTWEFKTWVAVGDGEPQFMDLEPGPTLRDALQTLLNECIERELASGRH